MLEFSTRALEPKDLFALSYVHDARLSPDGRRVASVTSRTAAETGEEFFEIEIRDLVSGAKHKLSFLGDATFPRWSPDGACLAFVGLMGKSRRLYVSDVDGAEITALT